MEKLQIHNLIIVDESGSMHRLLESTVTGINETLNTIRNAQKEFGQTQEHYVSIFFFQENPSNPSHYVVKNLPIAEVKDILFGEYSPAGGTPLYDAVGSTLSDLKAHICGKDNAIGHVTIITDGYENSSRTYSERKIVSMIDALKEIGWNFAFIGANIDVAHVSQSMHIDNALAFSASKEGVHLMFAKESRSRHKFFENIESCINQFERPDHERLKEAAKGYFDETEDDDEID